MKQLFKCEYCTEVGTEEEILKHEETCIWNYTKRTCYTCRHANRNVMKFTCCVGRELEEGKYMEGCGSWVRDDRDHTIKNPWGSVFGNGLL